MKNLFYKKLFFLCLMLSGSLYAKPVSEKKLLYSYTVTLGEKSFSLKLYSLEDTKEKTFFWESDEEGFQSLTVSKSLQRVLHAEYQLKGQPLLINYNYKTKKVHVTKDKKKDEFYLEESLNASETLFFRNYIKGLPVKVGESKPLQLLVPKEPRVTTMNFTYLAEEELLVGKKKYKAHKFKMGVNGFFESLFWPHTYLFWYDAENNIILRYEGPEKDGTYKVIQRDA